MLLDPPGRLWWHQFPQDEVGADFDTVTYEGKPAVAWWQGKVTETANGEGEGIIANAAYEPIAHIRAGNGQAADIHELQIEPGGSAWLDTYETICKPVCDESHVPVVDTTVQEIDISTGLVMWEWSAMAHVAESESEAVPANGVFDPYHLNSVQPLPGGRVLVSMRDTSGVYMVDQDDGAIVWQIAGKSSSFARGKGTHFHFQHDARLEGPKMNHLTLFDDEAGPPVYGAARGMMLKLGAGKVSLLHQYLRPETTFAGSEGSTQVVKGDDVIVGYGSTQYFSEFASAANPKRGADPLRRQLPKATAPTACAATNGKACQHAAEARRRTRIADRSGAVRELERRHQGRELEGVGGESAESLGRRQLPVEWLRDQDDVPSTDSTFEVRALDAKRSRGRDLGARLAVSDR